MNHKKLEALLDKAKAAQVKSLSPEIIKALYERNVIVPAFMPQDTDPEVLRGMLKNIGKERPLPLGANPKPCVLENDNGEKLLPVFTSEEQMYRNKNAPHFPMQLNMPYRSCAEIAERDAGLSGIVLNPYTHNVILRQNKTFGSNEEQTKRVTIDDYHLIMRQKLEASYLPKRLFEKRDTFIKELCKEKGNTIKALYEEIYDNEIASPYQADDFEFMFLNLRDDFMLCQISMPETKLKANTCPIIIFAWDKTKGKIWYYAIVLTAGGKPHLFEVHENGKNVDLGDAPSEGNELSTVIDLIQGANKDDKQ